ncbi:hypothetical protein LR007_03095 [candidate division NPL-UPA2 bacterium]|nr:hypothetical protein [candidate division NPL-UPA2 bacterium]
MNFIRLLILATFLLILGQGSHADEFMGVEELVPGMRGIGKTVFSGTKVEEFQVEVLGVLKNVWARGDLILIRIEGGPLEKTGVIAGMSGSPIYINGKLIGALAYAWRFSKEPIAGVTPIKEMLPWLEFEEERKGRGNYPSSLEEMTVNTVRCMLSNRVNTDFSGERPTLKTIQTPLMLSGFHPQVIKEMEPLLSKFGFIPIQSGGTLYDGNPPLEPGSTVGIQLIRGDLNASAIGTLTYRRGNRILAFGHPALFGGRSDLPLTGGYVHAIMPSQFISFKLSSATKEVGRVFQDRRTAISGQLGEFARMIPFQVKIKTQTGKEKYNFEVINHKLLSPMLIQWAAVNSILSTEKLLGESTVSLRLQVSLKGRSPILIENIFSDPKSLLSVVQGLSQPIDLLIQNTFEEVEVENVSLEVEIKEERKTAKLSGFRLSKARVRPGETVEVIVILKPFNEEYVTKVVELVVPEDTPDGKVEIIVSDAITARREEEKRAPYKFKPKNLDHLIKLMEEQARNTEVIIKMVLPRGGASISGEELPSLPGSILAVMGTSKEAGLGGVTKATNLVETKILTDWVISTGKHSLSLTVES